jgi:hypothetical protein
LGRGDSANGCAPLATSAVRQTSSEESEKDVFSNAAAGIAAASIGLNFSTSFRGLLLQESGNFFPFDELRLRPRPESRKYFL